MAGRIISAMARGEKLMVDYQIVKHCWRCKKRFVVGKSEAKKNYCDECMKKMEKEKENE